MNPHTHSHSHEHSHQKNQCSHQHQHLNQQQQNAQYQQLKHQRQVKSAFMNYSKDMRTSYDKIFNNQKLGKYYQLVRQRKRLKFEEALQANQKFLNRIVEYNSNDNDNDNDDQNNNFVPQQTTLCHNISKIRTTVKQFFRQWCSQSPQVKDFILLKQIAKKYLTKNNKILVPGCGLGRLTLQLIQAGFNTQGNQVTYFMLYGSNFILNCVQKKQEYKIYPFIHTLTNHENQQNMFRSIKIPDKVAIDIVKQQQNIDFSMAAGQFTQIYKNQYDQFHGIITCFFIDTANNIFQYIDTIHTVLKDNGIWINYGPLLYHFKDMLQQISIQLSWQQVKAYIQLKGFVLLYQQNRQTTYCHDPMASYMHIYKIGLTVWKKVIKNLQNIQNADKKTE